MAPRNGSPRKGTGRRQCPVTQGDPRAGVALSSPLAAAAAGREVQEGRQTRKRKVLSNFFLLREKL
jgi:hypothetical protein